MLWSMEKVQKIIKGIDDPVTKCAFFVLVFN